MARKRLCCRVRICLTGLLLALSALLLAANGVDVSSASSSLASEQLAALDAVRGGALKSWAQGSGKGGSKVLVLAGDTESHYAAVQGVLQKWNSRLGKPASTLFVVGRSEESGALLDEVSTWLRSRIIGDSLKWSIVFVKDADQQSLADLNELVEVFGNRKSCTDVENDLHIPACEKLLLVLSTGLGEEIVKNYRDTLSEEVSDIAQRMESVARRQLDDECTRELRKRWGGQSLHGLARLLRANLRQVIYPIFGNPSLTDAQALVNSQAKRRAEASNLALSKRSQKEIDLSTFENLDECIDESIIKQAGFVGQTYVLDAVEKLLKHIRHGWRAGDGPVVLLFAGPPGLGKTFLANLVARAYNCGQQRASLERERKYVHIDMVNYQDERSVDGFVDPAPGLQGTGILAEVFKVSQRTVVLLDEIEKCHPSLVEKMLLPMLDNNGGHVQSKKTGDNFPTRDSVFIMTTNCFSEEIEELYSQIIAGSARGLSENVYDALSEQVSELMRNSSRQCRGAHSGNSNPFSSGPFWRRLVAGSSLATRHGVLLFVPPSPEDIDELVSVTLESYSTQLPNKEIFYSRRAVQVLQDKARVRLRAGTLTSGTVQAFVTSEVKDAIPEVIMFSDHRNILLYQCPHHGSLRAMVVDAAECIDELFSESPEELADRVELGRRDKISTEKLVSSGKRFFGVPKESRNSPSATTSGSSSKDQDDIMLDIEVQQEANFVHKNEEKAHSMFDIEQIQAYAMLLLYSFAVMVAMALFTSYAVLPAAKALFSVLVVVSSLLWYFFPELFYMLVQLVSEAAIWLWNNWRVALPVAGGLYIWWVFLQKRRRSKLEEDNRRLLAENFELRKENESLHSQVSCLKLPPKLRPSEEKSNDSKEFPGTTVITSLHRTVRRGMKRSKSLGYISTHLSSDNE